MKNTKNSLIEYECMCFYLQIQIELIILHFMNTLKINLEHCFGIVKLSQKLNFAGENVALIYAPNGLMKTSFAKLYNCMDKERLTR